MVDPVFKEKVKNLLDDIYKEYKMGYSYRGREILNKSLYNELKEKFNFLKSLNSNNEILKSFFIKNSFPSFCSSIFGISSKTFNKSLFLFFLSFYLKNVSTITILFLIDLSFPKFKFSEEWKIININLYILNIFYSFFKPNKFIIKINNKNGFILIFNFLYKKMKLNSIFYFILM